MGACLSVTLASAGGGCGLFPDLGGLSGGPPCEGARCADSSAPSADGGGDGNSGSDSGSDSALDGTKPNEPFCAKQSPTPLLCEDFDGAPLPGAFATSALSAGGKLGLEEHTPGSGLKYLLSAIDPGATADATAYLYRNYPAANTFDLGFRMRVEAFTAGKGADIARIVLGNSSATHVLTIGYRGYLELGEQFGPGLETYIGHTTSSSPKVGEWARLAVSLNLSTLTVKATLDGNVVLNEAIDASWVPTVHRLQVGVSYAQGAADGWQLNIDDVLYDAK